MSENQTDAEPPQMPLGLRIVLLFLLLMFAGLCVHWLGLLGNNDGGTPSPSPSTPAPATKPVPTVTSTATPSAATPSTATSKG